MISKTPETETKAEAGAEAGAVKSDTDAGEVKAPDADEPFVPFSLENLKLPEGVTLPEATAKTFGEIMKKYQGNMKMGEELLALGLGNQTILAEQVAKANAEEWQKMNDGWAKASREDKEIGGEKLEKEVLPVVRKLIADSPEKDAILQMLDSSGLGSHPAVIKFLYGIGTKLTQGSYVTGTVAGTKTGATFGSRMFPGLSN